MNRRVPQLLSPSFIFLAKKGDRLWVEQFAQFRIRNKESVCCFSVFNGTDAMVNR